MKLFAALFLLVIPGLVFAQGVEIDEFTWQISRDKSANVSANLERALIESEREYNAYLVVKGPKTTRDLCLQLFTTAPTCAGDGAGDGSTCTEIAPDDGSCDNFNQLLNLEEQLGAGHELHQAADSIDIGPKDRFGSLRLIQRQ